MTAIDPTMTAIDPIATSDGIVQTYQRYLGSLLPLRDEQLLAQVDARLAEAGTVFHGPLLEMTPPFLAGASLQQLVDEGVLAPGFTRYFSKDLPGDRPLYLHQERSIRRAVAGPQRGGCHRYRLGQDGELPRADPGPPGP